MSHKSTQENFLEVRTAMADKPNWVYPTISTDWINPKNEDAHQKLVMDAVRHLRLLRGTQDTLKTFDSDNLSDIRMDLSANIQKLIRESSAYRDAAALLWSGIA